MEQGQGCSIVCRSLRVMLLFIIAMGCSLLAAEACAKSKPAHPEPAFAWDGSNINLGVVINRGNSTQTDINLGSSLNYRRGSWQNTFLFQGQLTRTLSVLTKRQANLSEQLNYSLGWSNKDFLYGAGSFAYNSFGPYLYQGAVGVGYGRRLIDADKFRWSIQAGPALRSDRTTVEEKSLSHAIAQLGTNIVWVLSDKTKLKERLRYDWGKPYNYLSSITTLSTSLVGHLSLHISNIVEYYSKIPRGSNSTVKWDSTTTIALAYNF